MVKTGGSLFIALALVVMLMPLLPPSIIFIRKVWLTAVLNVLRILCLFIFLQHLVTTFLLLQNPFIQAASQLAEFLLVVYLFKLMMPQRRAKEIMNMLMASFGSVVVTIYAIKGLAVWTNTIAIVQALILVMLAIIILLQLIGNRDIVLLNEPVFWIAGGIISYFGMVLFMELITSSGTGLSQQIQQEKDLVLLGTDMIRFTFFAIAAYVAPIRQS
jgi:hypothetical protein